MLSIISYIILNCITKYLTGGSSGYEISIPVVLFFQNLFSLLWSRRLLKFSIIGRLPPKWDIILYILKIVTSLLGTLTFYATLKIMPMAITAAFGVFNPIFTLIGASIILKESMDRKSLYFNILSLISTGIIVRVDRIYMGKNINAMGWNFLLPLASSVFFVLNKIIARKLMLRGQSPENLTIISSYLSVFVSLVLVVINSGLSPYLNFLWDVSLTEQKSYEGDSSLMGNPFCPLRNTNEPYRFLEYIKTISHSKILGNLSPIKIMKSDNYLKLDHYHKAEWSKYPSFNQLLWMLLSGLIVIGGRYGDNKSTSLIEIKYLLPLGIFKIAMSALAGGIIFGEVPEASLWYGIFFMILGTLL